MIETVHVVMPNNELLAEVIRLVDEGQRVTLPVKGFSMNPFIIGGLDSVELVKPDTLAVGDVVLAWINNSQYVVHRIFKIDGDRVQLMGDGNLTNNEYCTRAQVAARADYVVHPSGKKYYLYSKKMVAASRLWRWIRPVRRFILAIYRRTILKLKTRNIKE